MVPGTRIVNRTVFRMGQTRRDMGWPQPQQDMRHNLTVKLKVAEEHQDAASDSSRVDPDNSIHHSSRG